MTMSRIPARLGLTRVSTVVGQECTETEYLPREELTEQSTTMHAASDHLVPLAFGQQAQSLLRGLQSGSSFSLSARLVSLDSTVPVWLLYWRCPV